MRHLPFGLIVLACLLMLSRPLLSPDLVLLPADLLQHALPFVGEPDPEVQNRRVSDVIEQFYPYYSFVRGEFRKGRLPLWNPYVLSGTPFLATAVSAVLSPLNLLLLPISLESSYEWGALLKLIVAAAGVFLFLRRIGLSSWAAAIGGAAYSFSGYQIFFLLYPNTAVSMCMGWGLWAVEGLLQGPSRRGVAVVGVIVGVSILGGQPECSLLAVMAWTLYGLSRNWRRIGAVLGGSLLGVMMAALVLLPFVELVVGGGTLELRSLEGRNPWHIGLWELPALLYPYFLGSPSSESGSRDVFYGLIFVGLIPLLLAFGSFFSWRHRQVVRSLWAVAGAAFVILFGVFPFFDLFTSLPLLESANHLHSILVLQVSLAALAGIGADLFSSKKGSVVPRRLGLGVGALTGLVGLALFVQPAWNPDAVSGSYTLGPWRSSCPLYPLLVLGALPGLYVLKRQAFSFAVLVLILVNGVLFGVSFNPVVSRTALESTNSIVEQLGPHTHERIAATGVATLLPNYGMSLGLRDVRGYESLVVKRVPRLLQAADGASGGCPSFYSVPGRTGRSAVAHDGCEPGSFARSLRTGGADSSPIQVSLHLRGGGWHQSRVLQGGDGRSRRSLGSPPCAGPPTNPRHRGGSPFPGSPHPSRSRGQGIRAGAGPGRMDQRFARSRGIQDDNLCTCTADPPGHLLPRMESRCRRGRSSHPANGLSLSGSRGAGG